LSGLPKRNGRTLAIEDFDVLDLTSMPDIKPYVPSFDSCPDSKSGWLEKNYHAAESFRSDGRFR